jgi:hypothetical protein
VDPDRKRIVVNALYLDIDRRTERRLLGYPVQVDNAVQAAATSNTPGILSPAATRS